MASALVATLLSSIAPSAFAADDTVKSAAPAAPAAVDEVRLRDGGMVRGLIVEKSAAGDVTLQLPSGETRHYVATDIVYAGAIGGGAPPSVAPAPAPAPVPANAAAAAPDVAAVHFEGSAPGLRVHVSESRSTMSVGVTSPMLTNRNALQLTGESFRPLCVAPCDATLGLGYQRFAVTGADDASLVVAENGLEVKRGGKYLVDFDSKADLRTAGTIVTWGGLAVGAAVAFGGLAYAFGGSDGSNEDAGSDAWKRANDAYMSRLSTGFTVSMVGLGVCAASVIVGMVLHGRRDSATVRETSSLSDAKRPAATSLAVPVLAM